MLLFIFFYFISLASSLQFGTSLVPISLIEDLKETLIPASIAYCNPSIIKNWNCPLCENLPIQDVKLIENRKSDIQGYIGIINEKIVVAFRGTRSLTNWINNFSVFLVPFYNDRKVLVHQGFLNSFNSIKDQIINGIKELIQKYPDYQVSLVGHSLGGCLATITAYFLKSEIPNLNMELITLNSPRVGNIGFVKALKDISSYRIVNGNDFAAKIMLKEAGYLHTGKEIFITQNETVFCNGDLEDSDCLNKIEGISTDNHSKAWDLNIGASFAGC